MTVAIAVCSGLSALLLVIALMLPSINSPTVPFGVRVPAQYADDPTVVRQTRLYRWRVLIGAIVAVVAGVVCYRATGATLLLPLSLLVVVSVWYGCFSLANNEIRAAKSAGHWYDSVHQGIAVDTGLRTDPRVFRGCGWRRRSSSWSSRWRSASSATRRCPRSW